MDFIKEWQKADELDNGMDAVLESEWENYQWCLLILLQDEFKRHQKKKGE